QCGIWLFPEKVKDYNISRDNHQKSISHAIGFRDQHHRSIVRKVAIATVSESDSVTPKMQQQFSDECGISPESKRFIAQPIRSGGLLLGVMVLLLKEDFLDYEMRSVIESVMLELGT